jgi:hypothetical protein
VSGESNPDVLGSATVSPFARGTQRMAGPDNLLAKPSGRAVGGTMVDRATDAVMPMPDFATDPTGWTSQMKAQMWTALEAKGIVNTTNVNDLMRLALKDGKPGDKRSVFRCLYRHRRAFERKIAAGKAQRDFEKTVERWLVSDCALKPDIVRLVIKQSDIANTQRSLLARLVDVTMMSVEQQFNARRQYAAHWAANALDERVVGLWRDVHETGIAAGWTLQERVSKLNIALGGVAHIYMYPRSPEQAIAAFKEAFGDGEKPIMPPAKETTMAGNKFATFMGSFSNLCEFHKVPVDDTIRDAIRHEISKKLYGVESFKDLPDSADTIGMTKELKAYLDTHYPIGKPGIGDAKAEPPEPEEKVTDQKPANEAKQDVPAIPIATPIPTRELVPQTAPALGMSEAGFSTNFFWVDEYGQEEQFTMRESTWEKGLEALPKFKAKLRTMGYTPKGEWLAKHAPAAPVAQQPAAMGAPAPQANNKGTAMCALIKVARSFEGNKPQLQFECNGFEKSLKYTREPLINILRGVTNPFTGQPFTEADMTDNSMYGGAFLVDWERKEKDGKTFTNVLAVRNAGQLAKTG